MNIEDKHLLYTNGEYHNPFCIGSMICLLYIFHYTHTNKIKPSLFCLILHIEFSLYTRNSKVRHKGQTSTLRHLAEWKLFPFCSILQCLKCWEANAHITFNLKALCKLLYIFITLWDYFFLETLLVQNDKRHRSLWTQRRPWCLPPHNQRLLLNRTDFLSPVNSRET